MTTYLLLSAMSLLGMVVILAILALLRLLNAGRLPGVLIDGYSMLIIAFSALIIYVLLVRFEFVTNQETRIAFLIGLSAYILLLNVVTLFRLGRYIRDTVRLTRRHDGIGDRLAHSETQGDTREVRILTGNLRVQESTEGTTSTRVLRKDNE